jgi:dimethylhistidine N-methyltransferase
LTTTPTQLLARRQATGSRLTLLNTGAPRAADPFDRAVLAGLTSRPKSLPCRFFYDARGSELFEKICDLPEYYLTRTEDAILKEHARSIVGGLGPSLTVIELGSGSSTKTRRLLAAALAQHEAVTYAPIDISPRILEDSARALSRQFARLRIVACAGDYRDAIATLCHHLPGPRLVLFLGSSLGNYTLDEAAELLRQVGAGLGPDDRLVLGTDLAKESKVLEPAYDDAQGVTARFNLNLLDRVNRELGADFDLSRFAHRAIYRPERLRVEMHLESLADQVVTIPDLDLKVPFRRGETIHTENSHKYGAHHLRDLAAASGFVEEEAWTDSRSWYRVQRWRPVSAS